MLAGLDRLRRIWFVAAECKAALDSSDDDTCMELFFYDDDGRIVSSGNWVRHPNGDEELLPS